jgi:hypothetical protein
VLLVIAVLTATGTQWFFYQSIAWSTMFAGNLRSYSLSAAVQRTFDGRHPCCLCQAIAAGKKSEQKKAGFVFQLKKLEFPPTSAVIIPVASLQLRLLLPINIPAETTSRKPPTPPPRGFLA